jgi:hypothetical protein
LSGFFASAKEKEEQETGLQLLGGNVVFKGLEAVQSIFILALGVLVEK